MNEQHARSSIEEEQPEVQSTHPLRVLLLCDYSLSHAATVIDHINALHELSEHDVYVLTGLIENQGNLPPDLDLASFDAIVIHYSLFMAIDAYVSPRTRAKLARFPGVKAMFIQDEYRFIDQSIDAARAIDADIIFTCVPDDQIELV